ncbi:MAG: hypothetical protein R3B48_30355 [Kofleriaceae bacterium]
MNRYRIQWLVAIALIAMVVGACIVRSRPARPARGRPVYVVPAKKGHDKHRDNGHHHGKHKKHKKH